MVTLRHVFATIFDKNMLSFNMHLPAVYVFRVIVFSFFFFLNSYHKRVNDAPLKYEIISCVVDRVRITIAL